MSDPTQHWAGPTIGSAIVIFETDDGVSHQYVLTPTPWRRITVTLDTEVEYLPPFFDDLGMPPLLAAYDRRYTHTITLVGGEMRGIVRQPMTTVVQQEPQALEEK